MKFFEIDFLDETQFLEFENSLDTKFNVILSDMAPNSTGHKKTDNLRLLALYFWQVLPWLNQATT